MGLPHGHALSILSAYHSTSLQALSRTTAHTRGETPPILAVERIHLSHRNQKLVRMFATQITARGIRLHLGQMMTKKYNYI